MIDFWIILLGGLSSAACAMLGCFLVVRRMSMVGDAMTHAVLPGLGIAYLLTGDLNAWPMYLGAVVCAVICVILTNWIHTHGKTYSDAALGVVFTTFFAAGILIIQLSTDGGNVHLDRDAVLEGYVEFAAIDTVTWSEFWSGPEQAASSTYGLPDENAFFFPRALVPLTLVNLAILACLTLFWKELKLAFFDESFARVIGRQPAWLHYGMLLLVGVTTVAAFQIVGSIIVIAALVIPAAAAQLLTHRLTTMLILAVIIGVTSSATGYYFANRWDTNTAGMTGVMAGVCYALALVFAPGSGLLHKWWDRFRLRMRIIREDVLLDLHREQHTDSAPRPRARLPWVYEWYRHRCEAALVTEGLLIRKPELALTEAGRQEAVQLLRSHRLWESYLDENFDLPADHLHEPAERIEHFIGPRLQEAVRSELDSPTHDPHGREIPSVDPHGREIPTADSSDEI